MYNNLRNSYKVKKESKWKLFLKNIAIKHPLGIYVFLLFLIVPTSAVIHTVLSGWVLSIMWSWFITPVFKFTNLPVAPAIGIIFISRLFYNNKSATTDDNNEDDKKSDKDLYSRAGDLLGTIFAPLFILLIGYVIHQFFM